MKRFLLIILAILLVSAVIFTGCAKPAPAPAPSPAPAPAPAPAAPIKVGLLYPLTGFTAMTGKIMTDAAKFAFEDAGSQVAGRKIEVIVADSAGQPAVAIDAARKLVEQDKVCTILGPIGGDEKMAVGDYMSKIGLPHLQGGGPSTWPILTPAMPWSIAAGGSEQQYSSGAGMYAYEGMHYKTVTAITSDVVFARSFIDAFKAAFEAKGGKVIQEQYAPYPSTDFASYLANLKQADAVAAWFFGADAIMFLTQVQQFGIRKKMPVYCAFFGAFMAPYILSAIPKEAADACIGEVTVTSYSPFIDTDVNKKFVAKYRQKFGFSPDDTGTVPYDTVNMLLNALKATGGDTTPAKLKEAILNTDFIGVQGRLRFDKDTRCVIRDLYACKVDKVNGEYTWVPVYTIKDVPPVGFAPPPAPPPGAGAPPAGK